MKIDILGVKINSITINEVLEQVEGFINSNSGHFIVTPNPEFIVKAQSDKEFQEILNKADIAVPDGIGIMLAAKFFKTPLAQRITGNDLVWKISKLAVEKDWSLFLLGSREGVALKTAEKLKKFFPDLKIAGAESGGEILDVKNVNPELIKKINEAKPDILFVALGQGKQEGFIYYNLNKLKSVKMATGIGGVFDYISGQVKRAPNWIQKLGLEWLYRLIQEPKRWLRIYTAVIVFPWLILKSKNLKN